MLHKSYPALKNPGAYAYSLVIIVSIFLLFTSMINFPVLLCTIKGDFYTLLRLYAIWCLTIFSEVYALLNAIRGWRILKDKERIRSILASRREQAPYLLPEPIWQNYTPHTIFHSWRVRYLFMLLYALLLLLYPDWSMLTDPSFLNNTFGYPNVIILLIISAGIGVLTVILYIFREIRSIEVTFDGLEAYKYSSIEWNDALLFACYQIPGLTGRKIWHYELAGEHDSVIWKRLEHAPSWRMWGYPTIPFEQYNYKMQQLIKYICARTGRPLYDLTGPEPVQVYPPYTQKSSEDVR